MRSSETDGGTRTQVRSKSESAKPERDANGRFLVGNKSKGGRQKGCRPLRIILREAMDEAIQANGGAEFIRQVARDHPVQFLSIRAALEPKDVRVQGEIRQLIVSITPVTDTSLAELTADQGLPALESTPVTIQDSLE